MSEFLTDLRRMELQKILPTLRNHFILFTVLGVVVHFVHPEILGMYVLFVFMYFVGLMLLGFGFITLAWTANKRSEAFRVLFNLSHFLLAMKLFFVIWEWKNNPTVSTYEPEIAFYAFLVATMEYLRHRLGIKEAPNQIVDIFSSPSKKQEID
ncbi:MAG: hypothetical protein LCI00_22545 [Chloroflexi bacterium]|nr:hypothetical protein [Chloroflexota bacterium]MCC6895247.1 hypothetical protein [Anaerolineae bacterium]